MNNYKRVGTYPVQRARHRSWNDRSFPGPNGTEQTERTERTEWNGTCPALALT